MQRIIAYIIFLTALTGCFKDVNYNTTIVLRPSQQIESGGDAIELPGVVAYLFLADTTYYEVTSYEMAMSGIMSDKETGELISAYSTSSPYMNDILGFENSISLDANANSEVVAIVAIDTLNEDYGYTTYEVGANLAISYVAVNFVPWKEGTFTYGKWCFVVDTPYEGPDVPQISTLDEEEGEVEEVEEVEQIVE